MQTKNENNISKTNILSNATKIHIATHSFKLAQQCLKEDAFAEAKDFSGLALKLCPESLDVDVDVDAVKVATLKFDIKTIMLICDYKLALLAIDETQLNDTLLKHLETELLSIVAQIKELHAFKNEKDLLATSVLDNPVVQSNDLNTLIQEGRKSILLLGRLGFDVDTILVAHSFRKLIDTLKNRSNEPADKDIYNDIFSFTTQYKNRIDQSFALADQDLKELMELVSKIFIDGLNNKNVSLDDFIDFFKKYNHSHRSITALTNVPLYDLSEFKKNDELKLKFFTQLVSRMKERVDQLALTQKVDDMNQFISSKTINLCHDVLPIDFKLIMDKHLLEAAGQVLINAYQLMYPDALTNHSVIVKQLRTFSEAANKIADSYFDIAHQLPIKHILINTLKQCSEVAFDAYKQLDPSTPIDGEERSKHEHVLKSISTELKVQSKSLLALDNNKKVSLPKMMQSSELYIPIHIAMMRAYLNLVEFATNELQYDHCIDSVLKILKGAESLVATLSDDSIKSRFGIELDLLKQQVLDNKSSSALAYKINETLTGLTQAKLGNNYSLQISLSLQLIELKRQAELSYKIKERTAIPSYSVLYTELALAYEGVGDKKQAEEYSQLSFTHDPNNQQSIHALLAKLQSEKKTYSPSDPKTIITEALIKRLETYASTAALKRTIPPHILGLFDAVIQGAPVAYEMLKPWFDADKNNYPVFSQYLLTHDNSELDKCKSKILYDVASNIHNGFTSIESADKKRNSYLRLYHLAAEKKSDLALHTLGKYEESRYNFAKAKDYFKEAMKLGNINAQLALALAEIRDGNLNEAESLLQDLLKNPSLNEEKKIYINNHIASIAVLKKQALDVVATPENSVKNSNQRVVYFDFDNTLMRSEKHRHTFYEVYKLKDNPKKPNDKRQLFSAPGIREKVKLEDFYTGSLEDWNGIFSHLKQLGFTIGICTARVQKDNESCPLFSQFLKDFGSHINPDYIIFTDRKDKYQPLVQSCHSHGVLRKNALLVDDSTTHVHSVKATGIQVVHASDIVTQPGTFAAFKRHLIEVTTAMADTSKQSMPNATDEAELSIEEGELPDSPQYSQEPGSLPVALSIPRSRSSFFPVDSAEDEPHGKKREREEDDANTESKLQKTDDTSLIQVPSNS